MVKIGYTTRKTIEFVLLIFFTLLAYFVGDFIETGSLPAAPDLSPPSVPEIKIRISWITSGLTFFLGFLLWLRDISLNKREQIALKEDAEEVKRVRSKYDVVRGTIDRKELVATLKKLYSEVSAIKENMAQTKFELKDDEYEKNVKIPILSGALSLATRQKKILENREINLEKLEKEFQDLQAKPDATEQQKHEKEKEIENEGKGKDVAQKKYDEIRGRYIDQETEIDVLKRQIRAKRLAIEQYDVAGKVGDQKIKTIETTLKRRWPKEFSFL